MKRTLSPGRFIIVSCMVLICVVLAWCPSALALDPTLDVHQYAHTVWRIRDGFVKGEISSIAQTPDGYLWLGTEFGLLRFDGVKNIQWQPPLGQSLPSNWIFSLLASRDGTLWIGTAAGLASWKNGKLTQYPDFVERYIYAIAEDNDGTIWATASSVSLGKLCSIRDGQTQCSGEGSLGRGAFNLYVDSKGNLWAGVKDGLWRWNPGPPKFYALPGEPDGIQAIAENDDGTLLVGWRGGIHRLVDGKPEAYLLPNFAKPILPRRILRDPDGGLWIGTRGQGLIHVHRGLTDVFAESDGFSSNIINKLFLDREGSLWAGTSTGLDRFRDYAVAMLPGQELSAAAVVGAVLADRDGSLWLGTRNGLIHWDNGAVKAYRLGSDKTGSKLNERATALFQDDRGRVWLGTLHGFGYMENDRFVQVPVYSSGVVLSIVQDRAGNLWLDNEHLGLFRLSQKGDVQQVPWTELGHKDHASVIEANPSEDGLWIGFDLGGIAYYAGGQIRASYTQADGLGQGRVRGIQFDRDGSLWISTEGGLSRLKNGRIATLTSKNGLPCDTINWSRDDHEQALWLYTACGLVRVARPEIDRWIGTLDKGQNSNERIQVTVFDTADGVRSLFDSGHYNPQVARTTDGRLWFLPQDGVSVINPRHLPFNGVLPPVHVEQIVADRKTYDVTSGLDGRVYLPALSRDLQIDYTALSLVAPEKIRFRYKLEGYDDDWQEAGDRRQAFYTNLPPRNYRFRVIACNNSGVWNESGTYVDFAIAPAYYQTTSFRVLLVAAFFLLLGAFYQLRMRQVAGQVRARMEERLEERERIARDLHDTLLQSVQGLILKFDAVSKQIPRNQPAREAIEKTLDRADEVLAEGRDRVRNLRSNPIITGGLPAAFQRVVEENPQGRAVTFKTVVEGAVRELHPMVQEEAHCIGREALLNALTHSGGNCIEIEIAYNTRQFRLRVRDDGRGFDSKILDKGGRPDHWGLPGMRERADKIGAELKIWSGHQTGTEVELLVPGATAYQVVRKKAMPSWFTRFFSKQQINMQNKD